MTHRSSSAWHGAVIVVTGTIPGMTRQQAKTRIIGHGTQLGETGTGRATYPVWDGQQVSRKLREAVGLGTLIVTAQAFTHLADQTRPRRCLPAPAPTPWVEPAGCWQPLANSSRCSPINATTSGASGSGPG